MFARILHSYPARFVFVTIAIPTALAVVGFCLLYMRDRNLMRANPNRIN